MWQTHSSWDFVFMGQRCIKQQMPSPDYARFIRVYHMSPLNITNNSWIAIILSLQNARSIKKNYMLTSRRLPTSTFTKPRPLLEIYLLQLIHVGGTGIAHPFPPTKPCVFICSCWPTPSLEYSSYISLQVMWNRASLDSELLMPETLHQVGWLKHL